MLYQLGNAFRNTLDDQPLKDDMIINSLIFSCTKLVSARFQPGYSGPDSAYLGELFWLAVAVLEIAEASTYPLAVAFVDACLRALALTNTLQHQSLPAYLLRSRTPLEGAINKLDEMVGINFNRSFPFAMAALLAKGMKSQGPRENVMSAASVLLELSSRNPNEASEPAVEPESAKPAVSFEVLPYIALLIPIISSGNEMAHYLALAGLDREEYRDLPMSQVWKKLFSDASVEEILDNERSLLLLSLTATILTPCEREKELLLLYTFFAEAAPNTRSTFPYVYVSI